MSDVYDDDYVLNGKKFAVAMVLDVSGSMYHQISTLENKFNEFINFAKENEDINQTMDLALITFGSDVKDEFNGFCEIRDVPQIRLTTRGSTNMSDALTMANQLVRERTKTYRDNGIEAYKPWIILMTDGVPDDPDAVLSIGSILKQRESDGKVHVFAVGMGKGYNTRTLQNITDKCFGLSDWNFSEFFTWLGKSVAQVSQSTPGEKCQICDTGSECQDMMNKFFDVV